MCEMCESITDYECLDCGENCLEMEEVYYVNLEEVKDLPGHLCIGCLEKRIGRLLVESDFSDVPENHYWPNAKSPRYKNRLGSVLKGKLSDEIIRLEHGNKTKELNKLLYECRNEIVELCKAFSN